MKRKVEALTGLDMGDDALAAKVEAIVASQSPEQRVAFLMAALRKIPKHEALAIIEAVNLLSGPKH